MAAKKPNKPTKRRNALGRGLGALLDDSTRAHMPPPVKPVAEPQFGEIPVDIIEANPYQPRSSFEAEALNSLADSILVHGVIQPITVRRLHEKKYQLIAGERRLQAAKLAKKTKVPAYIRTADDQQMLEMALIENIQRENLNAIEIALSYQRLISECNLSQEKLSQRVGKNRTTVTNYLRLLKLPPDVQIAVRDDKISMGHARALINVENVEDVLALLEKTLDKDLSVRQVEDLVRKFQRQNTVEEVPTTSVHESGSQPLANELSLLQKRLSSHFGSKVVVNVRAGNKGEIRIPYLSLEDLNRILELIEADK